MWPVVTGVADTPRHTLVFVDICTMTLYSSCALVCSAVTAITSTRPLSFCWLHFETGVLWLNLDARLNFILYPYKLGSFLIAQRASQWSVFLVLKLWQTVTDNEPLSIPDRK